MIAHPVFERLVLRAGPDLAPAGIDGRRIARRDAVDARRFWRRLAGAAAEARRAVMTRARLLIVGGQVPWKGQSAGSFFARPSSMHSERTKSWSRLLACVPTRHRKTRVRKSCAICWAESAAHRFLTLFKTPLDGFVGNILEVFKAPKAEGVDFEFATGKRTEFLNLIDPSSIIGNIGPFTFAPAAKGPMVPDDPGPSQLTESGAGLPARFLPASAIASPA